MQEMVGITLQYQSQEIKEIAMKNLELFKKDPTLFSIPNDGVTSIQVPHNEQEWQVLEFELRSFVCEGEYQLGLERILSTFFAHLDQPKQPAVWISGFYGSGKSHLARVLEYLWKDIELPNGFLASSIVDLPNEINDLFVELKTHGKREGGLWSAAGTLSAAAGTSVRLALLSIVFKAAGLPDDFRLAKFVIWLKQDGYYDAVRTEIEDQGKEFDREIRNLYVSPLVAKALLNVIPGFANSEADARNLLKSEYPKVEDVSNDEFAHTLEYVLELQSDTPGKLPLTLLVLDELQQFIGEDQNRAVLVQEVVQVCTARFGSKLLFVGTGQSALEADVNLSRLRDRFTVKIQLGDKDVERVVRNVILQKRQDKISTLQDVLDKNKGEIDRHLQGTNIGAIEADNDILVPDYPLLPTRRRFWERTLRAIDIAGTAAQLRTQLRVTYEATKQVANKPVGNVVPADVIYWQQEPSMLQSGILLSEISSRITELNDGTEDGKLRSRICATIFLIGKLPTEGPYATGLKASADTLADLLVEDLSADSTNLRKRIPVLLEELVEDGILMPLGNEYRLQTREGAEWEADFNRRFASIRDNAPRIASERSELFRSEVGKVLKGLTLVQGVSKTPRKINLHFGLDAPTRGSENVPVWIRDEWNVTEKTVREDAQAGGIEDPIVYVLLPRLDLDNLRGNLARYLAAKESVDSRIRPSTSEGYEALRSMKAKQVIAKSKVDSIISEIVNKARIYQGGGHLISADTFIEGIKHTTEASLVRMFINFDMADNASWHLVVKRAQDGNPAPLDAIGYRGDADKHPVCQEVRKFIGSTGKKGADIRSKFTGIEFGWPRDAVDGTILALLAGGFLRASQNGQEKSINDITAKQITSTNFYSEGFTVSAKQRIKVRGLLTEFKISYTNGREIESVPDLFNYLNELNQEAGGDAPLPEPPDMQEIEVIRGLAGNERFIKLAEAQVRLSSLHKEWLALKKKKDERLPRWQMLRALQDHAKSLPESEEFNTQIDAIYNSRRLLSDPDPTKPLLKELVKLLRSEILGFNEQIQTIYEKEMSELENTTIWKSLGESQQQLLIEQERLYPPGELEIKTDDDLLKELNTHPLLTWGNQIAALPVRFERVKTAAAKILDPEVIQVAPKLATIRSKDELDTYLEELRIEVEQILDHGNPVVITRTKTY